MHLETKKKQLAGKKNPRGDGEQLAGIMHPSAPQRLEGNLVEGHRHLTLSCRYSGYQI